MDALLRSLRRWAWLAMLVAIGCAQEQGEICDSSEECVEGLVCFGLRCVTPDEVAAHHRQVALDQEAAKRAEELRKLEMLRQSGVEPQAEAAPPPVGDPGPAGGPGVVRVVRVQSPERHVFAACRPAERLLGGGCAAPRDSWHVQASYPSEFGPGDTLGARWNCKAYARSWYQEDRIEAYAMCQSVGPPSNTEPAASVSPAEPASGSD